MPNYKVEYYFKGFGTAEVEADSVEDAKQKFFAGEALVEKELGKDYNIETVEEDI